MPVGRAGAGVVAGGVDVVEGHVRALVAVLLHDLRDLVHDRRVRDELPEAAALDDVGCRAVRVTRLDQHVQVAHERLVERAGAIAQQAEEHHIPLLLRGGGGGVSRLEPQENWENSSAHGGELGEHESAP